jgi:hypothetical protein
MRLNTSRWLKRGAWSGALAGLAAATLVAAQPAPPQGGAPPQEAPPLPPGVSPGAPVAEEAPPVVVATPAPMAVPPISAKEVAPASPPKDQVVEKPTATPVRRARYDVAILQALDKVTAETLRFEAAVGRPVRYKSLVFTVRACERSAPDEGVEDSVAYITVDSQPRPAPGKPPLPPRQAFKGWMYASSPGLNPLEHPVYDAWLISCRTSAPVTPAAVPRPAPAAVTPAPKAAPAKAPAPKAETPAAPVPKAASPLPPEPPPAAPEPKR